jgi:para-aminobenzoate synthetase / 4-amino-4-deoxychorismate lyase
MDTLIFDFAGGRESWGGRVVYRDPVGEVVAGTVAEVGPAVAEVERAVAAGLHAAGFVAYEAAPAFEPRMRVREGNRLPLVWFGLFEGPVRGPAPGSLAGPGAPDDAAPLSELAWRVEPDRARYLEGVATVREAIAEGRTYQVNLTARLRAELPPGWGGDAVVLYEALRRAQGSGWHALLDLGRHVIMSVSPELFFLTRGRGIETRPMKGTRARGRWPEEDAALAAELASSEKERAENLMIVDLLRNDLGRVCETGSIRVPRLFEVERYRTVWQMTSSVAGRLRAGAGLATILEALFPCGSVTGAPKISTMELIAGLEPWPREVYCGAIGVVRPGCDMAFSVPIRTLWLDRETGRAEYGSGGGIVWDSSPEAEYDELLAKAVVVREPWPDFRLVETMAVVDGTIVRLERHLARLRRSADYFGFPFPDDDIRSALAAAAGSGAGAGHPRGAAPARRVRLVLDAVGGVDVQVEPLGLVGATGTEAPGGGSRGDGDRSPLRVVLAGRPVRSSDRFLYHKTTHREVYDARRPPDPRIFDVLLWNERGEVTEFTRGNVVAELGGRRVTPRLAAGLLPGCFREELLEAGAIEEGDVAVADLARAERLWFVNSARGWLEVSLAAVPAAAPGQGR